jgi:hypothetical protein
VRWSASTYALKISGVLRGVERDRQSAKFWLAPVILARNIGFSEVELGRIHELVVDHEWSLMEAWNDYFGD